MREILFRGKRADNGAWIQGYLFKSWDDYYICRGTDNGRISNILVTAETVGQYTGLDDDNGVKIFEGDIVECVSRMDKAKMVVLFESGEFRLVLSERFKKYVQGGGYHAIWCFDKTVIGNIHDNPELLEEKK